VLVRQIVLLSKTSVGLFEQDYHFRPRGKHSHGQASYAKNLLARPGSLLANASGQVVFSKPDPYTVPCTYNTCTEEGELNT